MTVHEGRRNRYIGFIVNLYDENIDINKTSFIQEMKLQCRNIFCKNCYEIGVRLIKFDGNKGIVKCKHTDKEKTIKLLKSIKNISQHKVSIETIGTSGTIKSLKKKHSYD